MEAFNSVPNLPPLPEETLRKLLAVNVDKHFGILVRTYQDEIRSITWQLTSTRQSGRSATADAIAQEAFVQMYGELKNFKADDILKLSIWPRLYQITVDRCLGQLVRKYESQIYNSVQRLLDKSKLEQSQKVLALAETIFSQIRRELKDCDARAIQTPKFWDWLHNLIIAHCFELLIETYRSQLQASVLKLGCHPDHAQDIVQEALLSAFRSLKEHGIPDKKDAFDYKGWIFQIAKHAFFKSLRKNNSSLKEMSIDHAAEEHAVFDIVDEHNVSPHTALELAEAQKNMEELIDKLPEPYRKIIRFRFLSDLSNAEIALRLTMKEVTLRTYIHRGLKQLRALLQNESQVERKS